MRKLNPPSVGVLCVSAVAAASLALPVCAAPNSAVEVTSEVHHDVSPPLRLLVKLAPPVRHGAPRVVPLRQIPQLFSYNPDQLDSVLQKTSGPLVGTVDGLNFAGVGQGDYGFTDFYAPPDTNGAVGAT